MMRCELKYGNGLFRCDLPGARVLTPSITSPRAPAAELVREALAQPLGSPRLDQIVRRGEKVTIVTSDITRYTGSEYYLPILVEQLNACGIADKDILVLVALGIHRKQSEAEHRKILGPLFGRVRIVDHECDDPAELRILGTTTSGMPVAVNRHVVETDRVIVTGTVGHHYFAGFGGGRKGLVPGVASRETCMATHFAVFNPPEIGGKHSRAVTGVLESNPVHEAILEAARLVSPDFLLNTVLTPDKRISAVFCGELEEAHLAGCELCREMYSVSLERPADLAVVSCGGYPKDINFIQAHKALDYGVNAVRPGGTLILLAACGDGFGNKTFFDWFRHTDLASFEKALRAGYEINGQTAYSTLMKARSHRVILVSELGPVETEQMGMEKARDLDDALHMARTELPKDPFTVIIPDGGTVLPVTAQP